MVKRILLLVLIASFASAECMPYWLCDSWSSCELGYRTRSCRDVNNCDNYDELPREVKRCDDPEGYTPINLEMEDIAEPEKIEATPDQTSFEDMPADVTAIERTDVPSPNIFIGMIIIAAFAVAGILVGRKLRNQ